MPSGINSVASKSPLRTHKQVEVKNATLQCAKKKKDALVANTTRHKRVRETKRDDSEGEEEE